MSGWNVTLYGSKNNALLHLGSVKFQAFPDIGAANFSGYGKPILCLAQMNQIAKTPTFPSDFSKNYQTLLEISFQLFQFYLRLFFRGCKQ